VPWVEWFIIGVQHGFGLDGESSAVEEQRNGLLLDCLYSQFVNEWAIPMSKGPEAIRRLDAWLHGDEATAGIPFSSKGIRVHCPIEVRVSDSTRKEAGPTPYLDFSCRTEPTLYLNAIMYRPYGLEPRCTKRYYQAFEWLMRDLGGKPHWAKNFSFVKGSDIKEMYGEDLKSWRRVRAEVDPEGVFVGDWIRRNLLDDGNGGEKTADSLKCEEFEWQARKRRTQGIEWRGRQVYEVTADWRPRSTVSSEDSFDHLAGAEAEASTLFEAYSEDGESADTGVELRIREGAETAWGPPPPFAKF
jgi:D-arabinono-1,4-lactone oxidase